MNIITEIAKLAKTKDLSKYRTPSEREIEIQVQRERQRQMADLARKKTHDAARHND